MKGKPRREGVMLCYPAELKKVEKLGTSFFSQPKLKGERCRTEWFHEEPVLLSSYGNEIYLPHIKDTIKRNFASNTLLDGEIYKHGWTEAEILSAAGRTVNQHPRAGELEYHIFDYQQPDVSQWRRIQQLNDWRKEGRFEDCLKMVSTTVIFFEDWLLKTRKYMDEGYEGSILRHPLAFYEKRRSRFILKYKPTAFDDYLIIGYVEGEGWAEGHLGAFLVQGDDETTFKVGSGKLLTKERRKYFWSIREELVGKMLIVKHEELKTSGGKPVCAVAFDIKL